MFNTTFWLEGQALDKSARSPTFYILSFFHANINIHSNIKYMQFMNKSNIDIGPSGHKQKQQEKSTCHNGSTALLIFYQILLYLADKCLQKYHVTLFCEQLILLVYFTMELHFTTYI